jgi:DivIVA domain-containing protein
MSTADGPPPSVRRPADRLTPARVRAAQFPRAAVGRRGYAAEAVDQFVRRMAEEITGRDAAEANLRAQLDRLRRALKQWQSRQLERRDTGSFPALTPEGRSVEAVNTLSHAQQQADAYIAQAQEYCRQITADARNRADAILCEAQERAEATTAQALRTFEARQAKAAAAATKEADRGGAGAGAVVAGTGRAATGAAGVVGVDLDELERRLVWARTFVSTLQSVEAQLTSSREALNMELDALDRLRRTGTGTGTASGAVAGSGAGDKGPALVELGPGPHTRPWAR